MPSAEEINRNDAVRKGELDVGRLFVDTKQIYLDARSNAVELDDLRLHVDVMYALVEMIGHLLREIRKLRIEITRGEVGLKGFDADLTGLQRRYQNLYRRSFEDMPPPAEWNDEQWKSFEENLEGPILMWDLKTCQERWGIPFGTPVCEGPDLLMALSLLRQLGVAQEVQEELIASVYGLADLTLQGFSDHWSDTARSAGKAIAQAFGAVAENVKKYLPDPEAPKRFALGAGVAIALGAGGYLWLKTRQKGK